MNIAPHPSVSAEAEPPPCELHLLAERDLGPARSPAQQVLPLPEPGHPVTLRLGASAEMLQLGEWAPGHREADGVLIEVIGGSGASPGTNGSARAGGAGLRAVVIAPPSQRLTAGGLIPDAPMAVLQEQDVVVWEPDGAVEPWTLHLAAFRRPIGRPNNGQSSALCPVCRRAIGASPIYRCACGACLHHGHASGERSDPPVESAMEAGFRCSRLATVCPVCQRPVEPDRVGYAWLPRGWESRTNGVKAGSDGQRERRLAT